MNLYKLRWLKEGRWDEVVFNAAGLQEAKAHGVRVLADVGLTQGQLWAWSDGSRDGGWNRIAEVTR